jgi:hypothetical protein
MQGSRHTRLRARKSRRNASYSRQLLVEQLEDRQLLATFNLTDAPFDGDPGSLRATITTANSNAEDDQINLAAGEYSIGEFGLNETANATGDFNFTEVNRTITITGADRDTTMILGGLLDRVMLINANVNVVIENATLQQGAIDEDFHNELFGAVILNRGNLTLNNVKINENLNGVDGGAIYTGPGSTLTLQDSELSDNIGERGANLFADGATVNIHQSQILNGIGADGAGIFALDTDLTITDSTIDSNSGGDAGNEIGIGGGIHIASAQGTFSLDLIRSTVSQNTATSSGGVHASGNGTVLIENSTISNNTATGNAQSDGDVGGIFAGNGATVDVNQSTIVRNFASDDEGGFGNANGDSADFFNTRLAENEVSSGTNADGPLAGVINSLGNNIIGETDGMTFTPAANDITGTTAAPVNPLLGDLGNNGGPTHTHLPVVASPAVDAGVLAGSPSVDQRGIARPQDGDSDLTVAVDIGAVEVQASLLVIEPEKDATLQEDNNGDRANGSGSSIFVGTTSDEDISLLPGRRGVIKFDLTGLVNPGAAILDARLELTQTLTHVTSGNRLIDVHKLTADWGEGASNSGDFENGNLAQPDDATWTFRYYDDANQQWTTPGGDYVPASSAQQTVTVPNPVTTPTKVSWSSPQLTQDILDWAANPASNHGWILIGEEGFNNIFSLRRFASREAFTADHRPKLIIEFDNTVGNDTTPPTVQSVQTNRNEEDPNDLPAKGAQPSNWAEQRSEIFTIDIEFNEPVVVTANDFTLTNLGVLADADADTNAPLNNGQITQTDNVVTITFAANDLTDGIYELTIHDTLTDEAGLALDGDDNGSAGGDFVHRGNATNRFDKLGFNFNGDTGVSVFDFSTFSYWFGTPVDLNDLPNSAPKYADVNADGGVSVFDFNTFSSNFGKGLDFPTAFQSSPAAADFVAVDEFDINGDGDFNELDFRRVVDLVNDSIEQMEANNEMPATPQDALRIANRLAERLELNRDAVEEDELELVLDSIADDIADIWLA